MRTYFFLIYCLFYIHISAQNFSFENGTIAPFSATNANLSLVKAPLKDGKSALEWKWNAPSELKVEFAVKHKNGRDGVIFWVYNEAPKASKLMVEYRDVNNNVQYSFDFGLNFTGWRICRIGSKYMKGIKKQNNNLKMYIISPTSIEKGRLFIDRFSFVTEVNYQNAPDAQQPENTDEQSLIHWSSLWKWESTLKYANPPVEKLTEVQLNALSKTESALDNLLPIVAKSQVINAAKKLFLESGIQRSGDFIIGKPLVVKPDKKNGDITLVDLGTMMMGMAQDALFNQNKKSEENFLLLSDYALNQGFAWGSSMGNNHHYGYEAHDIFKSSYMMRHELTKTNRISELAHALVYWSGLGESRATFDPERDGIVDCWNTLLFGRLIAAMMIPSLPERYRALSCLVNWVDSSLAYSSGNKGGIKPDGSFFHHAGYYPAYAIGGFEGLGVFIAAIQPGGFKISVDSRRHLSNALFAMSHYTNFKDWTIGISGRHPHGGDMNQEVVDAFAYLSLLGGIDNPEESIDKKLAAEYLRLETTDNPLKNKFKGIAPAPFPEGFFVMNHAALGVQRIKGTMVTIKGYNSDVWGSEIYTNDNRYGRYQSYGSVEILNGGSPVSRLGSRFSEAGWDWNRLPGTTTIHLPLNLLDSPQPSTLMARSEEDFAGASSLLGQYGIFGMKLKEKNDINNQNFTPDFIARKSVFVFGKRLLCVGTDISNSNSAYRTETTIFQNAIQKSNERISVNNKKLKVTDLKFENENANEPTIISDLIGNYYRISPQNKLIINAGEQISAHNKTRTETRGDFVSAYIDHGTAPKSASYEYMIMLQPNADELKNWSSKPVYEILQADKAAHIVRDFISGVNYLVCFELTKPTQGFIESVQQETLVMYKSKPDGSINVSVCDPSIHLPEKVKNSGNTSKPGLIVIKQVVLKGNWELAASNDKVELQLQNENTVLNVACHLGIPVEFNLKLKSNNQ